MGRLVLLLTAILYCTAPAGAQSPSDALMVVAHGSPTGGEWNTRVTRMIDKVEWPGPKGVAFLMTPAAEEKLPQVVAKLDQPGVKRIIIVPLLISSFSNHYEEIRYYAGELKHGHVHGAGEPLKTKAPMVVTAAMDRDPLVSKILADQVRSVSTDPAKESLVLLTHGPNEEEDNAKWMACMKVHGAYLESTLRFQRVEYATLRDDAPKPVKDAAIAHLREVVQKNGADSTVIIQPVLISVGQVQAEIKQLLAGMDYKLSESGVANHPLALEWIRRQAAAKAR